MRIRKDDKICDFSANSIIGIMLLLIVFLNSSKPGYALILLRFLDKVV